jgi:hypothetical protein
MGCVAPGGKINKSHVFSVIAIVKCILNTTDKIFELKEIVLAEHALKV